MQTWQFMLYSLVAVMAIGCDASVSKDDQGIYTVRLPAGPPLPDSKPLPALDEVFSTAEPGSELSMLMVFSLRSGGYAYPIGTRRVEVEKGSVTSRGSEAYVTYLPDDQVLCKPSEDQEELLLHYEQGDRYLGMGYYAGNDDFEPRGHLEIAVNSNLVGEDSQPPAMEYRSITLPLDESRRDAVQVEVEFSSDFQGTIDGWYVWTPG